MNVDVYTFAKLDSIVNPSVIFRGIVGSHAYGTANAASDTDIRGVFVVPSREYVRLVPPPKQVSDERNDRTYYSLLRFCELMAEANPTTMEMLYLPPDCILKTTAAFELLAKNRELFISQRAVDSHLGYAVSQIKKARGCNKRVWNPWPEEPPQREDYADAGAYQHAVKEHRQYWEWKRNRNHARWVQQERGELDYDAKNMMHLTRLLFSGENIVKCGEPIVRFEGEKLATLLSIRRGEWTFDEIMAHAEKIKAEIESGKGCLPVESDKARIDALIAEVMNVAEVT